MKTNRIVVLKDQIGFGIYDTVEESFISLHTKRDYVSVWTRIGYAKSDFRMYTESYFSKQDRYIIKEIK